MSRPGKRFGRILVCRRVWVGPLSRSVTFILIDLFARYATFLPLMAATAPTAERCVRSSAHGLIGCLLACLAALCLVSPQLWNTEWVDELGFRHKRIHFYARGSRRIGRVEVECVFSPEASGMLGVLGKAQAIWKWKTLGEPLLRWAYIDYYEIGGFVRKQVSPSMHTVIRCSSCVSTT